MNQLSFDKWLLEFKHGVYVFTSDSCNFCEDYKKTIKNINNQNLYIVETVLEKQKDVLLQITGRNTIPLTACYWENELQFVRAGQLFDSQLVEIFEFLKKFPNNPISESEKQIILDKQKNKCELTLYVFPNDLDKSVVLTKLSEAESINETAIDVDSIGTLIVDNEKRLRMIESMFPFFNLVVYSDSDKTYSELANLVTLGWVIKNGKDFIRRDI